MVSILNYIEEKETFIIKKKNKKKNIVASIFILKIYKNSIKFLKVFSFYLYMWLCVCVCLC
jgi:hypothetical protein